MGRADDNGRSGCGGTRHNAQNHDRLAVDEFELVAAPAGPAVEVEPLPPMPQVTPVQTMVSALTGSLITSLLGRSLDPSEQGRPWPAN